MKISKRVAVADVIDDIAKKMAAEYGVPVEVTRVNPTHYLVKMTDTVHNKALTAEIDVNTSIRDSLGTLESLYLRLVERK